MDDPTLVRRFGLIEQQLRLISEHLGIPCPSFASDGLASAPSGAESMAPSTAGGVPEEVVELARAGHKTEAVSRLRTLTGASLLEAKRTVDSL
jgi:large subunit ribosomal protein L7/L12